MHQADGDRREPTLHARAAYLVLARLPVGGDSRDRVFGAAAAPIRNGVHTDWPRRSSCAVSGRLSLSPHILWRDINRVLRYTAAPRRVVGSGTYDVKRSSGFRMGRSSTRRDSRRGSAGAWL